MHDGWINNSGQGTTVLNLFLLSGMVAAFWVLPSWVAGFIAIIGLSHMISHGMVGKLWKAPYSNHDWD